MTNLRSKAFALSLLMVLGSASNIAAINWPTENLPAWETVRETVRNHWSTVKGKLNLAKDAALNSETYRNGFETIQKSSVEAFEYAKSIESTKLAGIGIAAAVLVPVSYYAYTRYSGRTTKLASAPLDIPASTLHIAS